MYGVVSRFCNGMTFNFSSQDRRLLCAGSMFHICVAHCVWVGACMLHVLLTSSYYSQFAVWGEYTTTSLYFYLYIRNNVRQMRMRMWTFV
jgi:hypothetical protein